MIFISYAHRDLVHAKRLYAKLQKDGHKPWLDKECIIPGSDWECSIEYAIRECEYFIALLSQHSLEKRGYVQKEIKYGLDVLQTIPSNRTFLIPARLELCEPRHPVLQRLQWVDLFPDWNDGYLKLDRIFSFIPKEGKHPPAKPGAFDRWPLKGA